MSTALAPRCLGSAIRTTLPFAALFLFALAAMPASAASGQERYGYYRIVEGTAVLVGQGEQDSAQENQPLLSGDRLRTARSSRVEVELADGTLVRVDADSEVAFDDLAWSSDSNADQNQITLSRGEVQVQARGGAETRVDTDNASLYLRDTGSYRIETRDYTTLLIVREGSAEVRTRNGATVVRADEEAWIEDNRSPEVQAAGTGDRLERWAAELDDQYRRSRWDDDYVDSSLGYASTRMADYGSWVTLSGRRAWRPRVAADWSPYRQGRWCHTPSGLTWVSYEPWGWVPYHYGTWDYTPGWGWAWYPGRVYAPAWVYWYWGPSYVGWCPFGYYSNYYGPRWYGRYNVGFDYTWGFGRRVHGWGGGSYRHFDRWNFVNCNDVYDRRLAYRTRTAQQLGAADLPRGIIATDTRGLKPAIATRPSQGMLALANGAGPGAGGAGRTDRYALEKPIRPEQLPDLSRFVARDPNLSAENGRWALPVDRDGGNGGRAAVGVGGARPGEKPATMTIDGNGVETDGRGRVVARPGARGGEGVGGADASAARNGRPSGNADQDWRSGGAGVGGRDAGGNKPAVTARPSAERSGDGKPDDAGGSAGNWRQRPAQPEGNTGSGARGGRATESGVTAKPARPSNSGNDDAWRGGSSPSQGTTRTPRATVRPPRDEAAGGSPGGNDEGWRNSGASPQGTSRAPRASVSAPRNESPDETRGNDDSWRNSGRESTSAGRPPVRRIVEGVRSNRAEPNGDSARPDDKPSIERPRRTEPSASEPPVFQRPVSRPEPRPQREPDRPRTIDRQEPPQREQVRSRSDDSAPSRSRGAADRGSADRGSRDNGGGGRQHDSGGNRGNDGGGRGAQTRSSGGNDGGDPNR